MGRWGKVDLKGLEAFEKRISSISQKEIDMFLEDSTKELATRLLAKVIQRTDVGAYPKSSGKQGGTLRRGWTAETEQEAMDGTGRGLPAREYAEALPVIYSNGYYLITIINPVSYASYYEHGHRTSNHTGWVEGKHVLKISEKELEQESPRILEKKLLAFMKGTFK